MKKVFFLLLVLSFNIYPQFDTLLFEKELSPYKYGVAALGDQNSDGCDDILIYDCNENKASVYFGGSPMDTIPEIEFQIPNIFRLINAVAVDVNNDEKKDIMFSYTIEDSTSPTSFSVKVVIYYGGELLDSFPDIFWKFPEVITNGGNMLYPLEDFNGDGKPDIMMYCIYPPP